VENRLRCRLRLHVGRNLMDAVWAVTRKEGDPPISRSMMRLIWREFSVNDAAARRELGYVGKTSRTDGLRGYGEVLPSTASAVTDNRIPLP
jgi:hypothetical protein